MSVTPEMIGIALGRPDLPTVIEYQQWQMWIDDAVMLIDVRNAALNDPPVTLDPAKLDYVVREAVVAHVRRPDAATQVTISVQDATTSKTYRSGRGRVEIVDEWWTLLGLTAPTGGAYGLDTIGGPGNHASICALNFGGLYCSCGADLTNYAHPLFEVDPAEVWWPT